MEKPKCGSDGLIDEYDFPLHLAAVFIVFLASIGGCGFPVVAKKIKWMKIPPKVFFFCKHFGTGVLIATAFVHLLPTAFPSLNNPCLPGLFTDKYPAIPGVIMMGSLFVLFLIEMWLNSKTGGHTHGGVTGESLLNNAVSAGISEVVTNPPRNGRRHSYDSQMTITTTARDKKRNWVSEALTLDHKDYPLPDTKDGLETKSEMPPWFIVFYEQYIRQRDEMIDTINRAMPSISFYTQNAPQPAVVTVEPVKSYVDDDLEGVYVDPMVLEQQSMQITLIEGGILFHSVFVGMTVSITVNGFVILLVAIVFHQMFEGLGLGSRIAAVPYPKGSWKPWALVVAFGTTAPFGQALGLATRSIYDPESALGLILVGVCNAISSGLLLYAALVDLLAEDFLGEEAYKLTSRDKTKAFIYVLLGAASMSIVGAFA
ncbi:Zinc/iron permease [Delitschia confertaspora ATCC 74209]|uniref:Zinc/iron permease n=1 Tax=Delitschia confertaspora ATCC 74209 TaxID=1513339 RepID=A0A9P4JL49_9PLEO|nr:Zinc/iron permease [Delitschia confertaspora ATCC 74209]